jgi:membrane-bound lytic murein transglycosylase D
MAAVSFLLAATAPAATFQQDADAPPASQGAAISSPAARPGAAQAAVREAERRFQAGKALMLEGRHEEARRAFDAAIDLLLDLPAETPSRELAERKLEELSRQIHLYDLELLGAGQERAPGFDRSPIDEILESGTLLDPRLKARSLEAVRAATSQLPLALNDAVLGYINYFTTGRGRKTFLYGMQRAGRYRPMISRILDEEGVPQELIHLAQAESGFMPRAVSRKAATGMWQFVRFRGQEYGLMQSAFHDERLDPEKATRAAARHLRDLYQELGDWYLALAGYNCGPMCVARAVERTGYADFWELRRRGALPRETCNYVPAILAMTIIAKNPRAYDVELREPDPPLEYDTVEMAAPTQISLLADAADRPTADLRELNPFLLKNLAPAGVEIRVPKGLGNQVRDALEYVPEERRAAWRLHRIEPGDTLAAIAKRYATPGATIVAANTALDKEFFNSPAEGEMLLIPAKPEPVARPAAKRAKTSTRRGTAAAKAAPAKPQPRVAAVTPRTRTSRP